MKHKGQPVILAAWGLFLLLLLLLTLLLPPRQTADFVGIVWVTLAHFAVTATLLRLCQGRRGLLVTVGFAVTALLYWLGAVGVALIFRIFSLAHTGMLVFLEFLLLTLAALALLLFWYGRRYDVTESEDTTDGHNPE